MLWFGNRTRLNGLEKKNAELEEQLNTLTKQIRDLQNDNAKILRFIHSTMLRNNRGFNMIKIIQN